MSSRSIQLTLLMTALALTPVAMRAQSAVMAPKQTEARETSRSPLNVPIADIAATSGGCAILDKDFPGLRTHAMYFFFKAMSLNQIAAMSHGQITPDMLAQARSDLAALPITVAVQSVHQTDAEDLDFAPTVSHRTSDSAHR